MWEVRAKFFVREYDRRGNLVFSFPLDLTHFAAWSQTAGKYFERGKNMGFFDKLFGKKNAGNGICAPIAGQAVSIKEVPDPTFAEELLGKGIAIIPSEGKVVAPCDATVDMMFPTGHAVSLIADAGAEILIHVGLETVNLQGQHFTVHCNNGDKVKKGQLLIEMDLDAIKAAGYNTITPVVICNSADYSTFNTTTGKAVTNADVVIELAK